MTGQEQTENSKTATANQRRGRRSGRGRRGRGRRSRMPRGESEGLDRSDQQQEEVAEDREELRGVAETDTAEPSLDEAADSDVAVEEDYPFEAASAEPPPTRAGVNEAAEPVDQDLESSQSTPDIPVEPPSVPVPAAPRASLRSYDQHAPVRSQPRRPEPQAPSRPASPAAIKDAIEDVNRIIETLRSTLDEMEELLETLEVAERQKDVDEQEIESLRRALRNMHRPREGGSRR